MSSMHVSRRLGDMKSFNELKKELYDELNELEQGDVTGIDELKASIEKLSNTPKPAGLNETIINLLSLDGIQLTGNQYA